jgi:hypothetical protein
MIFVFQSSTLSKVFNLEEEQTLFVIIAMDIEVTSKIKYFGGYSILSNLFGFE